MTQSLHHMPRLSAVLAVLLALCLLPAGAWAEPVKKIFVKGDIYRMSVEGFRLNMSEEEAFTILTKNRWQGTWPPYNSPEVTSPFRRANQTLYLLRYRDATGNLRIWSVVNKEAFSRPSESGMPVNHVMGQIWIDSVISHYGEPSLDFINPNGINAYVYYLSNQYREDAPKLEIYLGHDEATYELSDRSLLVVNPAK